MNAGFRDLASGAFESGLAKLDKDPEWHDDRVDLRGPFRLSFPRAQGWGEELLVASLLKRHAGTSKIPVQVFACAQVCSILKHDLAFLPKLRRDDNEGRPPLAILRQALMGNLLDEPFVPLATIGTILPSKSKPRLRVGLAWASVSNSGPIAAKSVPVEELLPLLNGIDADFISLQRKVAVADPDGDANRRGVRILSDEILEAKTETSLDALIEAIRGLDYLVTISTTTTHIAAALGITVELIAADRKDHQWFWRVQASHRKHFYPTVRVHLGDGSKEGWWEKSLESLEDSLSKRDNGRSRVR